MGVVYRAYDTLLQRTIALKVISTSIEDNPELRERFFREARAAGQLSHRNIITIHDLGEHEGQPYLAMEYLTGVDLHRRLSGPEPMTLSRKLQIATEICEGLAYAHRHDVIHRDIKPANIFITDDGVVKILDFGLARMVASEVTASRMMLGTLNYMAPEQVRGERVDSRADIFSFGVVLYEMLSGRKAFQGDSYATTLFKILQEVPEPLLRIDASLPPDLVAIVERALAKARDERYQDLTDLGRDLVLVRQHLSGSHETVAFPASGLTGRMPSDPPRASGARPPSGPAVPPATPVPEAARPRRTAAAWLLGAAGIAVAAAVLGWTVLRDRSGDEPQVVQQPAPAQPEATVGRPAPVPAPAPPPLPPAEAAKPGSAPAASARDDATATWRLNADEARERMAQSKAGARAAGPGVDRASAYRAGLAAEREGQRLYRAGRLQEAAGKFSEATGFFSSAALAASAPPQADARRADPEPASPPPAAEPPSPTADNARAAAAPPAPPPAAPAQPQAQAQKSPETAQPPPAPAAALPEPPLPPVALERRDPPKEAPDPAAAAEARLRALLQQYEQALERQNMDLLKRLWPDLSGAQESAIRQEFRHARRIDVEIGSPRIAVSASTATVTFVRRYELSTVDGQRLVRNSRTTLSARRAGDDWVIESLKFEPLP